MPVAHVSTSSMGAGPFRVMRNTPVFRRDIIANIGLTAPLGLAALAWVYLVVSARAAGGLDLCIGGTGGLGAQVSAAFSAQWATLQPSMIWTWCVMVVAMMLPLAATHLSVAVAQTTPRFKSGLLAAALSGYLIVWVALGCVYLVLFLIAQALESLNLRLVSAPVWYGVAILWCFARVRSRALRSAHVAPFFYGGASRQIGAGALWGARLAGNCAMTCFLAMSAPMLSGQGLIGMFLVTHVLLAERRTQRPKPRHVAWPLGILGLAAFVEPLMR